MKTTLRARARRVWERLRGGELTPWRAAASVAIGLFIGVTPLWGTHVFLVMAVCLPLRLDARVAYLASNVSLPFIAPFLTVIEIEIGARIRTGAPLGIDRAALETHGIAAFALDLVVGTAVFAPAMAAAGFAITWAFARALSRRRPPPTLPATPPSADRDPAP